MERIAEHSIESHFLTRWSSRAMSGQPLTKAELMRVFEAARWAPSAANQQPWRFVYALAGTPHFDTFFSWLADGNKIWCARAGALVVVLSKKTYDGSKISPTHAYDAGAAWMCVALQAKAMNLVTHGMAGFDYDRAAKDINMPDDFHVNAMIALGHPGKIEDLPEALQARETPSPRRPVSESAFEGTFGG